MLFTIGQVTKMYNISHDTLRYYDKIDLLKPSVKKENGYRLFIVHDTKLNKCKDVLIENEDANKISMCYCKGNKSDIQLWKSSDNLKEQEAIFKNLMK
ncbi:MerR family transcriptional regulator [Paeniclostridium hominis]|uniref:MerR family transcriptional regulator n=1 Tax=Paeniclostridium hominis TaxID=2764329 RepID=UPI0022E027B8|nr:MerR family DNA-binding transcriptional regulator [Paeniclostridium hominis]